MFRTKEQQRALCRSCPLARVANLLGDSCSLLILRDLLETPRRFSDLEKSLSGISTRTLASKLKMLERDGLIRHVTAVGAGRGPYQLTVRGKGLKPVLDAMRTYGKKHCKSRMVL